MGGSIEFFILIILTIVIFPKIDFCTRKIDFSKKSTPKGGLNARHVIEVPKFFLSDMKVQDQIFPWKKNGGGSITIGRGIAYANLTRKFKKYRESNE